MNFISKLAISLLVTLTPAFITSAHAHGEKSDASERRPLPKEQKLWGIAGEASAVSRTVRFKMSDDMRFSPNRIEVREGETIRFVLKNDGKLMHEFVIGTKQELDQHAALMVKFPNMEHDEPYMAHVAPGKTGRVVWTFNRAGEFDFACLIAGHYQAGMVGTIKVTARRKG
ncbi:MAG TPA: cupredoxin family protein [Burkholderiaceae bacterium]|nr:cupredoxin family protein [Burkholderiaceae bacterium]